MRPEGYEALHEAVGENATICPAVSEGEDVRFVHFEVHPEDGIKQIPVTAALNRMTDAGLMERHGPSDAFGSRLPVFKVLAIDGGVVHLEDTQSLGY